MWAWLTKLVGGWIPIGTKPFPDWLGKVLWAVGIYTACTMLLSHFFPAKTVTTIGAGGTQIIQQAEERDMMGLGCTMFRAYARVGIRTH